MLRFIYTLIYYFCAPLLCLRWVYKSFQPPQYREPMRERFGFVKKQKAASVWFHAVSMGESIAAKSIIERLLVQHPNLNIVVTTTTPTGAKQIIEGLGNKVTHHYSPCDLPGTIKRFTRRVQPKVLVIMETELWPNWLHHLKSKNIPVILANARLSEKSARKYLKLPSLSRQMMAAFKLVMPVNEKDAKRFIDLGVEPSRSVVTGNIKFDQVFENHSGESFYTDWERDPAQLVWLAASTHKGEDEVLLQAHRRVLESLPTAKMIIVPRHPERFDEVSSLVENMGLTCHRRSQPESWNPQSQVMVGDSMGELMLAYKLSDIAFVGGSLVPIGGHNMIEPASLAKPVLSGPYVHNFSEVYLELQNQGGAKTVSTAEEIADAVVELMNDDKQRLLMGQRAQAMVEQSRGALAKTINQLEAFL